MKNTLIGSFAITLALSATSVVAQQNMGDMKNMEMGKMSSPGSQTMHMARGTVEKVDTKMGVVTLAHGPVKSLNWPSMTMGFDVKDKSLFDKLVVGKTVEFEFMPANKRYLITAVK